MAWTQLKQPNLQTKGSAGFCLKYAREVFGVPSLSYTGAVPKAWDAWLNAKYKHLDQNFPPVAILVWFKHPATGTTPGHVAVRLADGRIYSSPATSATSYSILDSISQVEQRYSAKYVGWSEDINNVRVAEEKGEDMYDGKSAEEWYRIANDWHVRADDRQKVIERLENEIQDLKEAQVADPEAKALVEAIRAVIN